MSWLTDYYRSLETIGKGQIKPVYFLYGNDLYLQDQAVQTLRASLRKNRGQFDYIFVSGSDLTAGDFQNALQGTSLFGSATCLVIQHVKGTLPNMRKLLLSYLKSPNPDNTLVLCADEMDYRNAFYKKLQAAAETVITQTPFENEVPSWIQSYVKKQGRSVEPGAIRELVRCIGSDLTSLSNELDKIDLYLPDGDPVDEKTVLHIIGFSKAFSPEDLITEIGNRNHKRAVIILKNLLDHGLSDVYINVMLYQHIWKLIALKDKRFLQLENYEKKLRVFKRGQISVLQAQAARYSLQELKHALDEIVRSDKRIKRTACDAGTNLLIALDGIMNT